MFNNDAVYVRIAKDEGGLYWSTEDFGVGLSESRVKDVFSSYLKSTKELSDNVIGCFGIGSKSPLSYTNICHITTRYNGKEYYYFLRKGESGPRIDKVSEIDTDKRNGTEIKVYIECRSTYDTDEDDFKTACQQQLAYFENIYFENCRIDNDFKLIKGNHWIANSRSPFNKLHINLSKVAYPIDWRALGVDEQGYSTPIALNFEIGELDIIPTREDLKYTEKTKKAIISKLKLLNQELIERWNSQDLEYTNIVEFYRFYNKAPHLDINNIIIKLENFTIDLKTLKKRVFKPFVDNNIDFNLVDSSFFEMFYNYYSSSYIADKSYNRENSFWSLLRDGKHLYRIVGDLDSKKSKYIREEVENHNYFYIIRKRSSDKKPFKSYLKLNNYKYLLNLKTYPKNEWRNIIVKFNKIVDEIVINSTTSYNKLEIPKEWLDKQKKKREVDTSTFAVEKWSASNKDKWNTGNFWKDESITHYSKNSEKLLSSKELFIVGTKEDKDTLKTISSCYYWYTTIDRKKFNLLFVAKSNLKYFSNLQNLITMENFMSEHNKVFRRTCTLAYIWNNPENKELINKLSHKDYQTFLEFLNKDFKFISELREYFIYGERMFTDKWLKEVCVPIALENNWLDQDILNKFNYLKNYFKGLPILDYIDFDSSDTNMMSVVAKYIRDHNKIHYKTNYKKLNPYLICNFNAWEKEALESHKEGTLENTISKYLKLQEI